MTQELLQALSKLKFKAERGSSTTCQVKPWGFQIGVFGGHAPCYLENLHPVGLAEGHYSNTKLLGFNPSPDFFEAQLWQDREIVHCDFSATCQASDLSALLSALIPCASEDVSRFQLEHLHFHHEPNAMSLKVQACDGHLLAGSTLRIDEVANCSDSHAFLLHRFHAQSLFQCIKLLKPETVQIQSFVGELVEFKFFSPLFFKHFTFVTKAAVPASFYPDTSVLKKSQGHTCQALTLTKADIKAIKSVPSRIGKQRTWIELSQAGLTFGVGQSAEGQAALLLDFRHPRPLRFETAIFQTFLDAVQALNPAKSYTFHVGTASNMLTDSTGSCLVLPRTSRP